MRRKVTEMALVKAVQADCFAVVHHFVELEDADINTKNSKGMTLLQIAICLGHTRLAKWLLENGASVYTRDDQGWSPLHDAVLFDRVDLCLLLLDRGADPTASTDDDQLPIDLTECESPLYYLLRNRTVLSVAHLSFEDILEGDELSAEEATTDGVGVDTRDSVAANKDIHEGSYANDIHSDDPINDIHDADGPYLPSEEALASIPSGLIAYEGELDDNVFSESTVDQTGSTEPAEVEQPAGAMALFQPPPTLEIRPRSILYDIHEDGSSDNDSSYSSENEMRLYFPPKDMPRFMEMSTRAEVTEEPDSLRDQEDEAASPPPCPRPRKSSIVLPGMKKPKVDGSRRRSVHFQPEVLLQQVVVEGDLNEVNDVLRSGEIRDVNTMSPIGLTALHQAALDGNLDCARTLILNGGDVNTQDCEGWTPLHAAAIEGHAQFVRFLLLANADQDIRNDDDETAYDIASQKIVKKMLLAAQQGTFLDQFADPHYVAESDVEDDGAEESDGYDDDDESNGDDESLDLSLRTKSVRSLVSERRKDRSDRNTAAEQTSEQIVDDHSGDVFADDDLSEDRDRLHSSVSSLEFFDIGMESKEKSDRLKDVKGGSGVLKLSYELSEDDQGISTMDGSSDSNSLSQGVVEYHLDEDLKPGCLDYSFQEAVLSGDVEALVKLIKARDSIQVNRVNKGTKVSALHHAILDEKFTMVQHLVKDFCSDLHVKDEDGYTPLHAASAIGNIQIAQFLLDSGAKASVLNNQCEFPVDVAQDEAMEQLLKRAMLGPPVGHIH